MVDTAVLKAWSAWVVNSVFHPAAVIVAPLVLSCFMIVLLARAFRAGVGEGFRSLSGILLPMVVFTFLYRYQHGLFREIARILPVAVFGGGLIAGAVVMVVVRFVARTFGIPFAEILVSASVSMLAFGYIAFQQVQILAACYGMFAGFLLYVIFLGLPFAATEHHEEEALSG